MVRQHDPCVGAASIVVRGVPCRRVPRRSPGRSKAPRPEPPALTRAGSARAEALEGPRDELAAEAPRPRRPRAARPSLRLRRAEPSASPLPCRERVVDEVPERLLEPKPVAAQVTRPGGRIGTDGLPGVSARQLESASVARRARSTSSSSTRSGSRPRSERAIRSRSSASCAGGRSPPTSDGQLLSAPRPTRRGAARARARFAAARAACAARGPRRRRRRARARAPPSSRSSISFSVSPSRSSSSPVAGTGSRSPGVSAEIAAARRRIASTGRRAAAASP